MYLLFSHRIILINGQWKIFKFGIYPTKHWTSDRRADHVYIGSVGPWLILDIYRVRYYLVIFLLMMDVAIHYFQKVSFTNANKTICNDDLPHQWLRDVTKNSDNKSTASVLVG